jgi:hypothetical protein
MGRHRGRDTPGKLRRHVQRTARAWSLDGKPLLGISVFAVPGISLEELLARRVRHVSGYLPTVGRLHEHGFELLPTGKRPHFSVRLYHADEPELARLLPAPGDPQRNRQYGSRAMIWREEGRDVPRGYHR